MIITIEGKQRSGKSTLALNICKGKNTVHICEGDLPHPFWSHEITESTDYIIVDDCKHFEKTHSIFTTNFVEVNKKGVWPYTVKMPNVILVKR